MKKIVILLFVISFIPCISFSQEKEGKFYKMWKLANDHDKTLLLKGVEQGMQTSMFFLTYMENTLKEDPKQAEYLNKIQFANKMLTDFIFIKDDTRPSINEMKLRIDLLFLEDNNKKDDLYILIFKILSEYTWKQKK
jgi:hypothetical protein